MGYTVLGYQPENIEKDADILTVMHLYSSELCILKNFRLWHIVVSRITSVYLGTLCIIYATSYNCYSTTLKIMHAHALVLCIKQPYIYTCLQFKTLSSIYVPKCTVCTLDHVIGSPRAHVSMSDTLASCMAAHCHCLTQSMQCSVVMCLQLANTLSVGACSCVPSSEMYMRMHANPLWSCTTIWRQYCNPGSQRPTLVLHLKLYLWLVDNMTNQTNQQCQSQNT